MSRIRTNLITNRMANGAPTVSHGLVVAGVTTITSLDLNGDLDVDGHLNADNVSIAGVVTATSFSGDGSNLTGITGTTINNNADNRIITGSGTANTLNGEANFTYNSDVATLTRSGNDNASGLVIANSNNSQGSAIAQVEIQGGDNASGRIKLECSGQHHTLIEDSVGNFSIDDNGSERLRIDSSGNVDIATGHLTISNDIKSSDDDFYVYSYKGGSDGQVRSGIQYDGNSQRLKFFTGTNEQLKIDTSAIYVKSGFPLAFLASSGPTPNIKSGGTNNQDLIFTSGSGNPERLRIDSAGKLYKGGNQFYPLVNYVEVTTFSGVNVSSSSYTDLRTVYSNYSPKKAGNRIVIHHQSQMWNGTHGNGNGDVFWRIMKDEGSGYSAFVTNERILGNHDGHSYTGGSGLARHHRTVHLMGSFICNGNNFNLKTQGRSMGIGWDWYHDANNILQIWEYELS